MICPILIIQELNVYYAYRAGPFVVRIVFKDVSVGLSMELSFPVSRSWCEVTVRKERDERRNASNQVIGLRMQGPRLRVDTPTSAKPTLCDFGGGTSVYAALADATAEARLVAEPLGAWRVEQRAAGERNRDGTRDGQPDAWTATVAAEGAINSNTSAVAAAEGWLHVMDQQCCVAVAMAQFGVASHDTLTVIGDGSVYAERWLEPSLATELGERPRDDSDGDTSEEETLLRCYYHFVPFPPQKSAATQPQAMLAPLRAGTREQ